MDVVALLVVAAWLAVTVWAWTRAPLRAAAEQFLAIWRLAWGKQVYVDFFGLQAVLALWMLSDGATHGALLRAVVCIAAMPVLGALPAAAYWLLRSV